MKHPSLSALAALVFLAFPSYAPAQNAIIDTIAGGGPRNIPSTAPSVWSTCMHAGHSGEVYVAGQLLPGYYGLVYRIDPSGKMSLIAGSEARPPYNEGFPATEVGIGVINDIAEDAAGNLYLSQLGQNVLRVDAITGAISRVAGSNQGTPGDGIPASEALVGNPFGLAFDASGNLYFSDSARNTVRRVDAATGLITTVAGMDGSYGFSGDGGPATSAILAEPREIALDGAGNLYIADYGNHRVRKVGAATGIISTIAGSGVEGFGGDGGLATAAQLYNPSGLALDGAGDVFLTDWWDTADGAIGGRVRRIDAATGIITRVAGGGTGGDADGIPASDATMRDPLTVDLTPNGDLLLPDNGYYLFDTRGREVDASTGLIYTLVTGSGANFSLGDGGLAIDAQLYAVYGVAEDGAGNLFASTSDGDIRRIDAATGIITRYAGDGSGFSGDGGPALQAGLSVAQGMALDPAGNLFVADAGNERIRRIDAATGIITTYAGDGTQGFGGDHGQATRAGFDNPTDVALDAAGNLYIADRNNHRIRLVDTAQQKINTFAGDGTQGFGGDDGPAASASLDSPAAVAFDPAGRLLIADTGNFRVRSVDLATGIITTVAGDGTSGFSGDGGPATLAQLGTVGSLAVDSGGGVLVIDYGNQRIRRIDASTGTIDTVAGDGVLGLSGDGCLATLAGLGGPRGIAAEANGGYVFGDSWHIRRVSPTSLPTPAGEVPDGSFPSDVPLVITQAPLGQTRLEWGPSCASSDIDYEIYRGTLGSYASHEPWFCTTHGATSLTVAPTADSYFYLVVPRSYAREGSYGRDSSGVERPASAMACIPQEIGACN